MSTKSHDRELPPYRPDGHFPLVLTTNSPHEEPCIRNSTRTGTAGQSAVSFAITESLVA